jgi:hypothetical protein
MVGGHPGHPANAFPIVFNFFDKQILLQWAVVSMGVQLKINSVRRQFTDFIRAQDVQDSVARDLFIVDVQLCRQSPREIIFFNARQLMLVAILD